MSIRDSVKALLSRTDGFAAPEASSSTEEDVKLASTAGVAPAVEAEEVLSSEVDDLDLPSADDAGDDLPVGEDDDLNQDVDDAGGEDDEPNAERKKSRSQKKVLKELALRKEAEKETARLKARVEQLEALSPDARGLAFDSEADIDDRRMQIRDLIRRTDDYIVAGGFESEDGKESLSVEDLKEMKYALEDERDIALPKAQKRILERKRIEESVVAEVYPDLLDPESDASMAASKLFEEIPGLKFHPEGRVIAGDILRMRKHRAGSPVRGKKGTDSKKVVKAPPSEPSSGAETRSGLGTQSMSDDQKLLQQVGRNVIRKNQMR